MNTISKTLLLSAWIALPMLSMAQQHCVSLDISRKLHQDALRSYVQDTLISEYEGKIIILEQEKASIRENFTVELGAEREQNQLYKENIISYQQLNASYESEINYVKKKERKARRERNVAAGIGVLLLGLAAVK